MPLDRKVIEARIELRVCELKLMAAEIFLRGITRRQDVALDRTALLFVRSGGDEPVRKPPAR